MTSSSRQDRQVSVTRTIGAPANVIFDLLADPASHQLIDGSDTVVKSASANPDRLSLGARFGMDMKLGVPYKISNEVVEFEEDRLIAWRHFGHHIWRYELEPLSDSETRVTETFDWGSARLPVAYEIVGYPDKHLVNMTKTLERLASVVE